MTGPLSTRAVELTESRTPYVHATVVRAQVPASACAGDEAIVLADGSIEGFVGGQCAEGSVRVAALDALADGTDILLRVLPEDAQDFPESPGARVVVNPCLSGGALEIFLRPVLPPPVIEIVGHSPIAHAVEQLCLVLGYAPRRSLPATSPEAASAVVIASHGRDEQAAIRTALDAGVGYIGLVASPRRGSAVLAEMELSCCERRRISSPAGLDLGCRTPPEVALSILAEVVARLRGGDLAAGPSPAAETVEPAIDPVCGMSVIPGPDVPHLRSGDDTIWFCNPRCRDRYAADQAPAERVR